MREKDERGKMPDKDKIDLSMFLDDYLKYS